MDAAVKNNGWWRRSSVGQRLPVEPDRDAAEGEYLHEDAVQAVRGWLGDLAEWFDGVAGVRPTFDTALSLLVGRHDDIPRWSGEAELLELADDIRALLADIYEPAWGREPREAELERLLAMAAASSEARWLC